MAYLFYFMVILVSAASVMFGLDLATSPLPSTPNVPIGRTAHVVPPAAHVAKHLSKAATRATDDRALSPIYPASPGAPKQQAQAAQSATAGAASKQASSKEWLPPAPPAEPTATSSQPDTSPTQQAAAPSQPDDKDAAAKTAGNAPPAPRAEPQPAVAQASAPAAAYCDVAACSAAYFSFRASDCSFQPYAGPRRTCARSGGAVTAAAPPPRPRRAERAAQQAGAARRARDQHEFDEVTRIVRQMTRGEQGDVAVQDSQGRIIVVHPGRARAYSPYDDYYGN
jgi:hypothetical protein